MSFRSSASVLAPGEKVASLAFPFQYPLLFFLIFPTSTHWGARLNPLSSSLHSPYWSPLILQLKILCLGWGLLNFLQLWALDLHIQLFTFDLQPLLGYLTKCLKIVSKPNFWFPLLTLKSGLYPVGLILAHGSLVIPSKAKNLRIIFDSFLSEPTLLHQQSTGLHSRCSLCLESSFFWLPTWPTPWSLSSFWLNLFSLNPTLTSYLILHFPPLITSAYAISLTLAIPFFFPSTVPITFNTLYNILFWFTICLHQSKRKLHENREPYGLFFMYPNCLGQYLTCNKVFSKYLLDEWKERSCDTDYVLFLNEASVESSCQVL